MNPDELLYENNEEFNQSIDDETGELDILGSKFRPSEVLFKLNNNTYHIAKDEFKLEREQEFKELVYEYFPTPIAYYFRQTHFGFLDNNNRLHLLRSTWEAVIFVLYAIVIGEARKKNFPLRAAGIRENDLYNFSVDRKLSIIEKILVHNRDNALGLKCGNYFDVADITKIKELNYQRNGFQHAAALSEEQAAALFAELLPEVIGALKSISKIQDIEVFHFMTTDGNPLALRCETFIGQSPNRTLKTYTVTAAQLGFVGAELNNQTVLAKIDDDIFSITPFLHFKSDDDGHLTNLCYLHQVNPDNAAEFKFEISRRSVYTMMPVANFNDRMIELRGLTT